MLQSVGSQRVRQDNNWTTTTIIIIIRYLHHHLYFVITNTSAINILYHTLLSLFYFFLLILKFFFIDIFLKRSLLLSNGMYRFDAMDIIMTKFLFTRLFQFSVLSSVLFNIWKFPFQFNLIGKSIMHSKVIGLNLLKTQFRTAQCKIHIIFFWKSMWFST